MARENAEVSFLFAGEETVYPAMARQLYDSHSIFRQALDRCDEIIAAIRGQSLLERLYPENDRAARPLDSATFDPHFWQSSTGSPNCGPIGV